jgi:hypothetical protein
LAFGVYEDWHAFWTGFAHNASEIDGLLQSRRADADGVGLGRNPLVANIDIVISRGEKHTGKVAKRDVVAAGCVIVERESTGAVLKLPVLRKSASAPMAVFRSPAMLSKSAPLPLAVL